MRTHQRRRARRACRVVTSALCTALVASSAGAQDDLDDILGGFDDEDPAFEVEDTEEDEPAGEAVEPWWDLSGSFEVSASINYLHHESDTGTDYFGLQRWRNRLNLQLDLDLSEHWRARIEGWGFYDVAYAINGRSNYTGKVLSEYELDAEVGEAWVHGKLHDAVDLKLGRQIVIWGRSETLRVLDILNPLDNREPGRVDIEDLRRPLGMLKLDAYHELWGGDWNASAIAIPEIRFDRNPVRGSDFFPGTTSLPKDEPDDFHDTEVAAAITGLYSGWDISLHGAWFWNDNARFALDTSGAAPVAKLVHDRLWLVGAGGNFTTGSWLFKAEVAYLDGFDFESLGGQSFGDKARADVLVGFEYYGWTDISISVEGTNRHLFHYDDGLLAPPNFRQENSQELAFRYTQNFLNDTLHMTALAVLFGWDASHGSIVRLTADYDLRDALVIGAGVVLYQDGDGETPPFDAWGRNDRVIMNIKWSF